MSRILITGIGGPAGSSLASQLKKRGHYVLGVDMLVTHHRDADDVVQVPAAAAEGYLRSLTDLVLLHDIDLLIPTVSDELPLVAKNQAMFGSGVRVLIGEAAAVAAADDKYATMQRLQAAGVNIPLYGLPSDFASTQDALECMGGPIIVKPRVSRGGRGVVVIDSADDQDWGSFTDSQIVQSFAPGIEYAPVVFAASSALGDVVVVLEKTELKEGRVGNALKVVRPELGAVEDVAMVALATARGLKLTGPLDIDVRRLADGTPVVLEVNARFGANSAHAPELLDAVLSHETAEAL